MMEAFFRPGAAFAHLDLLIRREMLRLRQRYELSMDEFRGLYVSDAQVEALLSAPTIGPDIRALNHEIGQERAGALAALLAEPRWAHLARAFALSPFETLTLFAAFAPLAQLKYGPLYAYLNDDVARRGLTVSLALRLGAGVEGAGRPVLLGSGRLRRLGLLETDPGESPDGALETELRLADPLSALLLGAPGPLPLPGFRLEEDGDADPLQALTRPDGLAAALQGDLAARPVVLTGPPGSGRRWLLRAALAGRGLGAASLELDRLMQAEAPERCLRHACLATRLAGVALIVTGIDQPASRAALEEIAAAGLPLTICGADPEAARALVPHAAVFAMPEPSVEARQRIWSFHLQRAGVTAPAAALSEVADLFALPFAAIGAAADALAREGPARVTAEALKSAARARSAGAIGTRAQRVCDGYELADLVLPDVLSARLGDFIAATRHRRRVYDDWGMARRLGAARGLAALFTGASGTGKTMAASVIARELGLDLYRIDLSGVVSKYIGETEKNLDAVFEAARGANCILFFDEADALFGKRSEVKDAHDRYANIECAYLLQKMEAHDGLVILTTNMPRSLDAAFSRRIQFVIDFPRPDAALRERLWRGMFPPAVPLAADVDFAFLARSFELTGGEIRNVALDAALGAAAQAVPQIAMARLLKGVERQMVKQGRAPSAAAFRPPPRPTPTNI